MYELNVNELLLCRREIAIDAPPGLFSDIGEPCNPTLDEDNLAFFRKLFYFFFVFKIKGGIGQS